MNGSEYDVIVVGGGHNGLICAGYLARAGLEVLVVERRLEIGGGLSTEESTKPGFLHNLHSVFHDAVDHMPAMRDLELEAHGARYVCPPVQVALVLGDGRAVTVHLDRDRTEASLSRFSAPDAAAWMGLCDDYGEFLETVVMPALYAPPAAPAEPLVALQGSPEGMGYLRLSRSSPADAVDALFESDPVRAAALFQLAVPRGVVPDYDGLGMLVPLVVSGVERAHLAVGGSHTIAHALWRSLLAAGGRVWGTREVTRILVEDGRASGVVLDGEITLRARKAVVSAIDLPQTFDRLLSPDDLPEAVRAARRAFKLDEFSLFGLHLALKEPPRYTAAGFDPDVDRALKVGIGWEGTADFARHFEQVRRGELPEPRMIASAPTVHDPTQAPEGMHTALCWVPAPYALAEGGAEAWDRVGETYADRCLSAWREVAPNMNEENVIARRVLTPLDVTRKISSMPEGGVFHGRMTLDQIEAFRPLPGLADGRTPVGGLYLGGACIHPGGGILGACGYIAAGAVLNDAGIAPWWE